MIIKVFFAALLFAGCATAQGTPFPATPPKEAMIIDEPIHCEGGVVLYFHGYDTNSDTLAGVIVVGESDANHGHQPPFLIIILGDEGTPTFYLSVDGTVQVLTLDMWGSRYGLTRDAACKALKSRMAM